MMPSSQETPAPTLPPPPAAEPGRGPCQNCGVALLGEHCYACGQPVKGLVRHFSSLVGDFLDSVFDWDGRLPRTVLPLFTRPGYLSADYFAGRRVRYVSPVRLFFFIAIVTFFVAQLTLSFGVEGGVTLGGNTAIETALTEEDVVKARDAALAELAQARVEVGDAPGADAGIITGEAMVRAQADARIRTLQEAKRQGKPPPPPNLTRLDFGQGAWDAEKNPIRISGLPQFANDWLNAQAGRTARNDALLGAVPSTLFILLPLFALMLKVLYVFRRHLYMEHLIVALHSHAFLCLSLLLLFATMALRDWLAPATGALRTGFQLVVAALWTWMPIYLLLMQKRVYGQGWTMTLLKYTTLGILYIILLSLGAAFTAVLSLVWM
jgi:hypothetical protein